MIPSVTAAGALMKRFAAQGLDLSPERRIPPYAGFVFFADFLIFLPALLMVSFVYSISFRGSWLPASLLSSV